MPRVQCTAVVCPQQLFRFGSDTKQRPKELRANKQRPAHVDVTSTGKCARKGKCTGVLQKCAWCGQGIFTPPLTFLKANLSMFVVLLSVFPLEVALNRHCCCSRSPARRTVKFLCAGCFTGRASPCACRLFNLPFAQVPSSFINCTSAPCWPCYPFSDHSCLYLASFSQRSAQPSK